MPPTQLLPQARFPSTPNRQHANSRASPAPGRDIKEHADSRRFGSIATKTIVDIPVEIMGCFLQTYLTPGGIVAMRHSFARILESWYEQIGEQARHSAVLHADETGWRVQGKTYWLWCFTSQETCFF